MTVKWIFGVWLQVWIDGEPKQVNSWLFHMQRKQSCT